MADGIVDMDKLAREEAAKGNLPPTRSAISDVVAPTASEEAEMRQLLGKVTMEELNDQVRPPQAPPVVTQQPVQTTPEVPAKFQKPDGTVDEEKLKTSSQQLEQAVEKRQKSIDEMVAEYKANEEKLRQTGQEANNLKKALQSQISEPSQPVSQIPQNLPPDQLQAQLLRNFQNDPLGVIAEISRVVSQKEAAEIARPALQASEAFQEQQRDRSMRQNLLALAEQDGRIQDPNLYNELINELNSDPGYRNLKNPLKSAWNEVKDRLRLGEPTGSAQPGQASGPILGRGVPPSVSSLPQPMSPDRVQDAVRTVNPFSEDGKKMEEALLKQLGEQAWR